MILLAGFFEVLFRGFIFVGLALAIGGILFRTVVLTPSRAGTEAALRRNLRWIALGGWIVCFSQLLSLASALASLGDESGSWPIAVFLSTTSTYAGLGRALLALVLASLASFATRRSRSSGIDAALLALSVLLLATGAWLTHGASRIDHRALLMSVTVIHQLAAVVWIGGLVHLVAQWQLLRQTEETRRLWPELPARFSPVALVSVACLISAGLLLSLRYVGSFAGLVGTAYGTMILTKIVLMLAALAMGGLNFLSVHRRGAGEQHVVFRRLPMLAEAEVMVGVIILLAASALTSQPPAVDTVAQRATPAQVARVFVPKPLQLVPAPLAKLNASQRSVADPFVETTQLDRIQSNFNHNVSGLFVVLIGLAALLNAATKSRLTRHWPLLFIPFGLFLVVFSQPTGWPLGRKGFFESFLSAEVLQHRAGTLLALVFGLVEWRVQTGNPRTGPWRMVFPLLSFIGGALLLTHTHSFVPDPSSFLIEISHDGIAVLAVLAGILSWLERRATGTVARVSALLWPVCFVAIGYLLLTYQEVAIR